MTGRLRSLDSRSGFLYLRKWTVVSIATGIVAGLGALALIQGIDFFTKLFLVTIAGYTPPLPGGETQARLTTIVIAQALVNTRLHRSRRIGQWPNSC